MRLFLELFAMCWLIFGWEAFKRTVAAYAPPGRSMDDTSAGQHTSDCDDSRKKSRTEKIS